MTANTEFLIKMTKTTMIIAVELHVTISSIDSKSEEIDDKVVYMNDIEKRKEAYGICGECNEPGTGEEWLDKWIRGAERKVALKSLDNSSNISTDFLNEIKSHLQIYTWGIVQCFGITQNLNTKDYMMVLYYCKDGNLRNYYLTKPEEDTKKLYNLSRIANGLLDIHNAEKIHKDFHLGMCQSANNENKKDGVCGVLPYMAPEVLRGFQYIKSSRYLLIGIMMNEYFSEEIPFNDTSYDEYLAVQIYKLRLKIFESTPRFLADLIMKC
ncbi:kinase-like domain-containing protein [Rhizophagus diaphanus]|nr:kinase-like domain-containing protein [Rhizophagus diaphanus] [Rhizophagus sp. MUCL 43196]